MTQGSLAQYSTPTLSLLNFLESLVDPSNFEKKRDETLLNSVAIIGNQR